MSDFFIPATIAFFLTYFATPLVIKFANYFGLVDNPKLRHHPAHVHHGIIPRAGGLVLLAGIAIPSLLFLPLTKPLVGILIGAFLTTVVGLWDDWKDSSPYIRFIANIIIAVVIVSTGIGIPFITNPFGGVIPLDVWKVAFSFFGTHSIWVLADFLAIIWLVWMMNIVGWSSGVDGQMPGFVAITAITLGIFSLRFSAHDIAQTSVATLTFVVAGAFLGFLPWNFYPQKIMPGYGGKTLAGLFLGTIAILSGGKVGSALLILAIPAIDALYILIYRLSRKKSPFRADRNHLHHRLLDLGWGKRRIALFYWGVSAILSLLALTLNSQQKFFVFAGIGAIIGGLLLWLMYVTHPNSQDPD